MTKEYSEIAGFVNYPCGRKSNYSTCCKPKGIIWKVNQKGDFIQRIPMHPAVTEAIKDAHQKFEQLFHRKFKSYDMLFYEKYMYPDDFENAAAEFLETNDVEPAVRYAVRKTDLLLTKENEAYTSQEDLNEWDNALKEYDEAIKKGVDLNDADLMPAEISDMLAELAIGLKIYLYYFGLIIERPFLHPPKKKIKRDKFLILFYLSNVQSTLRTIFSNLEKLGDITDYSTTRFILENYFRISAISHNPKHANNLWAQFGLYGGSHKHPTTKKGKINYKCAVDIETGEEIELLSIAQLAEKAELSELYTTLYGFLSTYAHSNVRNLFDFFDNEKGFFLSNQRNPPLVLIIIMTVNFLILEKLNTNDLVHKVMKKDIKKVGNRFQPILCSLIEKLRFGEEIDSNLLILRRYLQN